MIRIFAPVSMQSRSRLPDEREIQRLRREEEERAKQKQQNRGQNRNQNNPQSQSGLMNNSFGSAGGKFNRLR